MVVLKFWLLFFSVMINVNDFEKVVEFWFLFVGWVYYLFGVEDEISMEDV